MENRYELANAFKVMQKAIAERLKEAENSLKETDLFLEKISYIADLEEIQEDVDALERLVERYLY